MVEVIRSWWQFIKAHRIIVQFVAIFLVIAIILILIGYQLEWTGLKAYNVTVQTNASKGTTLPTNITVTLPSKTLYDWLQLLIVPTVLVVAGYVINLTISRGERAATEQRAQSEREAAVKRAETEHEIAEDNQHETALKEYIDKMSELLLEKHLRESQPENEVRKIARIRTLLVLRRLDSRRKRAILVFLFEASLIDKNRCIIDLGSGTSKYAIGANLEGANLRVTSLPGTNLSRVNLRNADLTRADLSDANLCGTSPQSKKSC
jgi:hypothetical protein